MTEREPMPSRSALPDLRIGERVFLNGLGLDGLSHPATVVGFLDDEEHPRHGQPIIVHDDEPGVQRVVHPVFLWTAADHA